MAMPASLARSLRLRRFAACASSHLRLSLARIHANPRWPRSVDSTGPVPIPAVSSRWASADRTWPVGCLRDAPLRLHPALFFQAVQGG